MARLALDHITIRCRDLEASRRFYADILGLESGYRPPFEGPPGAWLYDGGRPVVHLYVGAPQDGAGAAALDHIAFVVEDVAAIKERLRRRGQRYETATVPEIGAEQVFFDDPDGVGLEVANAPAAARVGKRAARPVP